MIRNIFTVSLIVCFSSILIADASLAGGRSPVPSNEYDELKSQLESSNMGSTLGDSSAQVLDILSATQQDASGIKYHILATVAIKGRVENICFTVQHNPRARRNFFVTKAQVGAQDC